MRKFFARGIGINLKTGKQIDFKIAESISQKGLESIVRNIRIESFKIKDSRSAIKRYHEMCEMQIANADPEKIDILKTSLLNKTRLTRSFCDCQNANPK